MHDSRAERSVHTLMRGNRCIQRAITKLHVTYVITEALLFKL